MPVTRDADYPAEIAQLVQAFNHCADGHEMSAVVEAAGNMLSASLHNYGRALGMSEAEMMDFARGACKGVFASVELNWKRKRKATDVIVKTQ